MVQRNIYVGRKAIYGSYVYSVGANECGQLGLGHKTNQNVLNKISNIPPIKIISCVNAITPSLISQFTFSFVCGSPKFIMCEYKLLFD